MSFLSQLLPEKWGPTPTRLLASARLQVTSYGRQAEQTCQNPSWEQGPEGTLRGSWEAPQPPTPSPCQHSKSARGSWARPSPPALHSQRPWPERFGHFSGKTCGVWPPEGTAIWLAFPGRGAGQNSPINGARPKSLPPQARRSGGEAAAPPAPACPTGRSQRRGRCRSWH